MEYPPGVSSWRELAHGDFRRGRRAGRSRGACRPHGRGGRPPSRAIAPAARLAELARPGHPRRRHGALGGRAAVTRRSARPSRRPRAWSSTALCWPIRPDGVSCPREGTTSTSRTSPGRRTVWPSSTRGLFPALLSALTPSAPASFSYSARTQNGKRCRHRAGQGERGGGAAHLEAEPLFKKATIRSARGTIGTTSFIVPPAAPCPWRAMTAFSSERPDAIVTDPVPNSTVDPAFHRSPEPAYVGEFDLEERRALRRVAGLSHRAPAGCHRG